MGKILFTGFGAGGVNDDTLSSITAQPEDVLENKTIVNKNGDLVVGTMKNISAYDTAVSVAANSTDLYLRMHNGAHVTNTTSGYPEVSCSNATALNAMGIQSMAGGTYTPSSSQQTIACTGKRMTSDIIIPGFTMPPANVIAWGTYITTYNQTVGGTYEGYHKGDSKIYWHGSIPSENQNFSIKAGVNENGSIIARSYGYISVSFTRTFASYNQMVIKGSGLGTSGYIYVSFIGKTLSISPSGYNGTAIVIPTTELRDHGYFTITVQVSGLSSTSYIDEIYLE